MNRGVLLGALAGIGALGVLLLGVVVFGAVLWARSGRKPADNQVANSTNVKTTDPQSGEITKPPVTPATDPGSGVPVLTPPVPGTTTPTTTNLQPPPAQPNKFAEFFGTKAMGTRFCIIADCSGSMTINNRMGTLKEELEKTLKGLGADQQFYVIYFSSYAIPMPENTWLSGGSDVDRILPWIKNQRATGGTQPMTAFQRAMSLNPKPDVIFFMTDGIIPTNVPEKVASLNTGPQKVQINTILFGGEVGTSFRPGVRMSPALKKRFEEMKEQGEKMLRQLATDSGGNYRFVSDTPGATTTPPAKGKRTR